MKIFIELATRSLIIKRLGTFSNCSSRLGKRHETDGAHHQGKKRSVLGKPLDGTGIFRVHFLASKKELESTATTYENRGTANIFYPLIEYPPRGFSGLDV